MAFGVLIRIHSWRPNLLAELLQAAQGLGLLNQPTTQEKALRKLLGVSLVSFHGHQQLPWLAHLMTTVTAVSLR